MAFTVISGGQTGVDRAALDVALTLGVPCGGWCPEGRQAEDGPLSPHYPLRVLPGADYQARTRRNVIDSDGTLIIYFEELEGGTALTAKFCLELHKPCKLIDGAEIAPLQAAEAIRRFVRRHGIESLNVAGPRASKAPRAYAYTREVLTKLLSQRIP